MAGSDLPGPQEPQLADTALLVAAAEAAGPIALKYWKKSPEAWDKPGGAGPVSEADLAVNQVLEEILVAARPAYGWLSEESPDAAARLAQERVFIIDPIDGTRAYLEGDEAFAISLAVAEAGRITSAAVLLPARGWIYAATRDGLATRDGVVIHPSQRQALEGADLMTNKANLAPEHWPGGLPPVRRSFRSSLAWRLCLAAEGRADAMLSLRPTWEWDSAAGGLIAEMAGCRVSDRLGQALRYNQPDPRALEGVVAAPPVLHRQLLQALGHAAP